MKRFFAAAAAAAILAAAVLGILSVGVEGEQKRAVSDPAVWKTGKTLPEFVDSLALAWCNATAQDAVMHTRITREELVKSSQSLNQCSAALSACTQEKRNQQVNCDEEKLSLESRLADVNDESLAQVAYWKEKCQSRITVAECNYQKQMAVSKCQLDTLEVPPQSLDRHEFDHIQISSLEEALAACRLQKAFIESNSTDEALVRDLKEQIHKLYQILAACGALFFGLIPALIFMLTSQKAGKRDSFNERVSSPQVLTAAETVERLSSMCKGFSGCVKPLLTSLKYQGEELFFLLIPVNCSRSRSLALFGTGGDFTSEVESSRHLSTLYFSVSSIKLKPYNPGAGLTIILYDHTGCAFSRSTLQKMSLTPAEMARRAAPRDSSFPRPEQIGVLFRDSGLYITNSDEVQLFNPVLWEQPWIQLLGGRTG